MFRLRFALWSATAVLLLAILGARVLPSLDVQTDILALLPNEAADEGTQQAVDHFSQSLSGQLLLLIGADDVEHAKLAADAFGTVLTRSSAFSRVAIQQNDYLNAWLKLYRPHRSFLLAPRHAQMVTDGVVTELETDALRAAYTPTGLMRVTSLAEDPLGLGNELFQSQVPKFGAAQLDGRHLMVRDAARVYVLVSVELNGSPFVSQIQDEAAAALDEARKQAAERIAPRKLDVVMSGAMQHAKSARERATDEMTLFGALETLLLMVLLVVVFSAVRPLALGALTLCLAFAAGLCAVQLVFGRVHILALVFGSSLIGGVIDYSIHFFADRFRGDPQWTPQRAANHVGGAIFLGFCTTLLAYLVLLVVPFPGLRQIALFCAAGLAMGCLTVLCAYPVLYAVPRHHFAFGPVCGAWLAERFLRWRWTGAKCLVAIALVVGVIAGLSQLKVQDDVRTLQSSPPELLMAEQRVRALLKAGTDTRYFLIQSKSEQGLLQREAQLTAQLDKLIEQNLLQGYRAVSQQLPSVAQQQSWHRLIADKVANDDGPLRNIMQRLGFAEPQIQQRQLALRDGEPLLPAEWLASDVSQGMRLQWLGLRGGYYSSIVTLEGVKDVAALRDMSEAGNNDRVRLVDRVQSVSDVLRTYRERLTLMLGVAYVAALVLMCWRYGWREGAWLVMPSLLASLLTLGLFGWLGVPLNLFVLLALWLVLGLGVDYGIFLRHGKESVATAVLSVTLSALTTQLAFGMLAVSSTPFIRSIGLTLLFAITLSWLLAMLSGLTRKTYTKGELCLKEISRD